MIVVNKNSNEKYTVYNITYDNAGYPHFLIYKDGQWIRMSAKHFRPYKYEDIINAMQNLGVTNLC